ncbi:MAG: hypothetical protein QMB56_03840, partial [Candidatus Nanopelagicales bacterium]
IDEFISSGEQKWGQRSSVTLLLPHGQEGQGPDHSSGRIERFLQLCAQDNMSIAVPSTPASYFHLLRWQVLGRLSRPLIVFTPKSLLRSKASVSPVEDFTTGVFHPFLPDTEFTGAGVTKVLICSGKVYFDLLAYRLAHNITDTAIVRLERIYPLPGVSLPGMARQYPDADLRWVQEEPANQGAWSFVAMNIPGLIDRGISCVSRPASSTPAVGTHQRHVEEQESLIESAFN